MSRKKRVKRKGYYPDKNNGGKNSYIEVMRSGEVRVYNDNKGFDEITKVEFEERFEDKKS